MVVLFKQKAEARIALPLKNVLTVIVFIKIPFVKILK